MEKVNERVKIGEKLGFMSYSTASNIIYNFKGTYYLIFLTSILGLSIDIAGIIIAIGTVWDALNDPLITITSNNRRFKNGDRIRPYALWFCVPWAISVVLLFTNFRLSTNWTIAACIAIYFVFEALYTYINIPYNGLASLATDNEADRTSINSFRGLGSCLGSLIGSVAIIPLIRLFGGLSNGGDNADALTEADSTAVMLTTCVLAVICIIGCLIQYFTSKERLKDPIEEEEHIGLIKGYKILFKCKNWKLNVLYIVGYSVTTALIMNNIAYYAQYNLGLIDYTTYILAAYLVAAIATAFIVPILRSKIGHKKTMLIPLFIMALGKLPFIIWPGLITVFINAFTTGIGLTATFILLNVNRNSVSDILAAKTGRRVDQLVAGGDGLIDKLSQATAILIFTQVLKKVCGFVEKAPTQPVAAMNGIQALIGWIPLIMCCILIIVSFFIDPEKELKEITK